MNLSLKRTAAAMALASLLSACSMLTPPDANRLLVGLEPTNELGYEADPSGQITVSARNLLISTRPGMPVTTVTGYRAVYRDDAGALRGTTGSVPQTLNVVVPAGWTCSEPDPALGCNALSEGARPAPGVP